MASGEGLAQAIEYGSNREYVYLENATQEGYAWDIRLFYTVSGGSSNIVEISGWAGEEGAFTRSGNVLTLRNVDSAGNPLSTLGLEWENTSGSTVTVDSISVGLSIGGWQDPARIVPNTNLGISLDDGQILVITNIQMEVNG